MVVWKCYEAVHSLYDYSVNSGDMPSQGRRPFLRHLSASMIPLLGGCSLLASDTPPDRATETEINRELDPVPTEGELYQVSQSEFQSRDPKEILRTAISNRSNCIRGEIPAESYNSGLLVTTKTVVESGGHQNVAFPSQAYRHLKQVTPRVISVSSSKGTPTRLDEIEVFIRAILRQDEKEDSIPSMAKDC